VCAGIFVFAAAKLNTLCLVLSPVALIWAAGYSLAKRFTSLTHFWLGSVLGLAPVAGWIAVHPVLVPTPVMFFWGVTFWVAGFDILYSCQDVSIDRMQGLNSLPARYGVGTALVLALFSHLVAALMFFMAGWQASLGWVFYLAWSLVSLLLIKEHTLISEEDMSRVNMAFFTFNGLIAIVLCLGIIVETLR
jgi:4-hydroxybenzoate polyprenyltransferase